MAEKDAIIEENRRRYDALYAMIVDRNTIRRRRFVAGCKDFIQGAYAEEIANPADPQFRNVVLEFFAICGRDDAVGSLMQCFCMHICILEFEEVRASLCPVPPNPDTNDPDPSQVHRAAFGMYEQHYLKPMAENLINGCLTVPAFTRELNAVYGSLLPADPLLEQQAAAGRRNQRHIELLPIPNPNLPAARQSKDDGDGDDDDDTMQYI